MTEIAMLSQIALSLFIFFLSLGLGGGLYETLVVYPNWKNDPTPQNLSHKLKESGQALAGRRFWPFISPTTALLALINTFIAWHSAGLLRTVWLAASIAIILKSIATYTYFVPTMIRKFGKAESVEPQNLRKSVSQWTSLSPLRLCLEFFAWVAAVWSWSLLGRV
jgi:hypothetical protein